MDESLSDFQEKKKTCTGPKISKNSKPNKTKTRKPIKHVKGQKDIRTVLKSKKNELITYSKEFDNVCKKSGVDVDPEQLQLAIALSNSLQDKDSSTDSCTTQSSATNSQARISKIRTTLQQYGFKVPKTIKTVVACRKVRKHRNCYKLLTITNTERLQIISDKYAQVLLDNLDDIKPVEKDYTDQIFSAIQLHNIATNIPYKYLRKSEIFYVPNLVEISNSTGCLLRDWANIPGRPVSPILTEDIKMNIKDIECSQEELDVVLSGTIKCTKVLIKSKENTYILNGPDRGINLNGGDIIHNDESTTMLNPKEIDLNTEKHNEIQIIDRESNFLAVTQYRSCSPDIFDDEVSVVDNSSNITDIIIIDDKVNDINSQEIKLSNDVMDLTECVNVGIQRCSKPSSQLSQKYDITKRKSNDFMEITECVARTSQPIHENHDNVDLTQSSDHNDDTIIEAKTDFVVSLDLTQSSDSSADLPFVNSDRQKLSEKPLDDTIILNDNDYSNIHKYDAISPRETVVTTQNNSLGKSTETLNQESFFEYVHENFENQDILSIGNEDSNQGIKNKCSNQSNDIDLTQSSSSTNNDNEETSNKVTLKTSHGSGGLGKSDNISIDYDAMFDEVCESITASQTSIKSTSRSNTSSKIHNSSNNETEPPITTDALSLSQNSEVFEISDRELDYSMHKSRLEEPLDSFGLVGTSGMDENAMPSSFKSRVNIERTSHLFVNDSLPMVDIRKGMVANTSYKLQENERTTPIKEQCTEISIKTPNNGDYLVKTVEVTPMPDYKSMTSPDRNKELDKYGLKPFKRKRAINLLTYLYNQTHPIAEPCSSEDLPSPSKKLKRDDSFKSPNISQRKSKSPKKASAGKSPCSPHKSNSQWASPVKDYAIEKDCKYKQTDHAIPSLREIHCDPDDWVFQKREKAKIHSCRVPLHIAFHNYVSCRRELKEAILRYEPIHIDVVHKELTHYGYRYDPKDLLKFLDKKCITVKTKDNNARSNKR